MPRQSFIGQLSKPRTDVVAAASLGALNDDVTVALDGRPGAAVVITSTDLLGTLTPEQSFDNGVTWVATVFVSSGSGQKVQATDPSFTGGAQTVTWGVVIGGGATHARVRVSAYTSGGATATLAGTDVPVQVVSASPDVTVSGTLDGSTNNLDVQLSGRTCCGVYIAAGLTGASVISPHYVVGASGQQLTYFISPSGQIIRTLAVANLPFVGSIWVPGGATSVGINALVIGGSSVATLNATAAPSQVSVPIPSAGNLVTFGGQTFGLPLVAPARLGGTPFTLRAAGAITPPVVTATQPPQVVMTFAGKIPGATVNSYVLDWAHLRILGAAGVATTAFARIVKRHVLYRSTQTAAPAAGAVPTGAALAYTGAANGGGTYQYKYVAVDIWGNEGNLSAASANVAPAANNGVTVTMPAVPAGAAGYNVYRTVTGPGATWFFIGRTNTTTFRDVTPDSALVLAAGTIAAWGTLPAVETPATPMELVMEKFVALGTAPTIMSTKTFPGVNGNNRVVTIAPGVAVGRYRIPGEVETKAFLAAPTITTALARDIDPQYLYGGATQINAAFGDVAVNGFNLSDAGMGGTFVVWGHELIGETDSVNQLVWNGVGVQNGIAEGSLLPIRWMVPPVFDDADEIAFEVGCGATAVAVTIEAMLAGRLF